MACIPCMYQVESFRKSEVCATFMLILQVFRILSHSLPQTSFPSRNQLLERYRFPSRQFLAQHSLFLSYAQRGRSISLMFPRRICISNIPWDKPMFLWFARWTLIRRCRSFGFHLCYRGSWLPPLRCFICFCPQRNCFSSSRCSLHFCVWGSWFPSSKALTLLSLLRSWFLFKVPLPLRNWFSSPSAFVLEKLFPPSRHPYPWGADSLLVAVACPTHPFVTLPLVFPC